MKQATVNNELTVTYPDSYEEMSAEELQRYFKSEKDRWGAFDAERHVILGVSWKKAGFFSFMSDAESQLFDVEARMKRSLINYRRKEGSKTKIAKKKGYGISFEYRVNNANMYQIGEMKTFKYKGHYYTLQYLGRRITDEECRPDFEKFAESVTLR